MEALADDGLLLGKGQVKRLTAVTPDYKTSQIERALWDGRITVYSKQPIENGVWVSPSKMEAKAYAGDGETYWKKVPIDSVAWVDSVQGMYADTIDKNEGRASIDDTYDKYQSIALIKPETMDNWLSSDGFAASNPDYAQAYIGWIGPRQFLRLTTRNTEQQIRDEGWYGNVDEMSRVAQRVPIQLIIDSETGEVTGHEGRHRMAKLESMDVDLVPVLFFDYNNKYSKVPIDSITLTGQFDPKRVVDDIQLTPLSNRYKDDITEEFVTGRFLNDGEEEHPERPIARFSIDSPVDVFGDPVSLDTSVVTNATPSVLSDHVFYADGNAYVQTDDGQTVVINNVTGDSPEAKYINTLETINNADRTATKPYTIPASTRNADDGYNLREQNAGLRRGSEEVSEEYQEESSGRTGSISERNEQGEPQGTEQESVKASLDFSKIPNIQFFNEDGEVVT